MSESYLGQIRLFSFVTPPKGWVVCDGSLLPVEQYQVLASLLGNTFGGDGQKTFGLPDLRGRVPMHQGNILFSALRGQAGGKENVTLTNDKIPIHTHEATGSLTAPPVSGKTPIGNLSATITSGVTTPYAPAHISDITTMNAQAVSITGGGQAHDNMQPYMVLNYCISTQGYDPQNS